MGGTICSGIVSGIIIWVFLVTFPFQPPPSHNRLKALIQNETKSVHPHMFGPALKKLTAELNGVSRLVKLCY